MARSNCQGGGASADLSPKVVWSSKARLSLAAVTTRDNLNLDVCDRFFPPEKVNEKQSYSSMLV